MNTFLLMEYIKPCRTTRTTLVHIKFRKAAFLNWKANKTLKVIEIEVSILET